MTTKTGGGLARSMNPKAPALIANSEITNDQADLARRYLARHGHADLADMLGITEPQPVEASA